MSKQKRKGIGFTNSAIAAIVFFLVIVFVLGVYFFNRFAIIDFTREVTLTIEADERGTVLVSILNARSAGGQTIELLGMFQETGNDGISAVEEMLQRVFDRYALTIQSAGETRQLGDPSYKGDERLAVTVPLPGAREGHTQAEAVLII